MNFILSKINKNSLIHYGIMLLLLLVPFQIYFNLYGHLSITVEAIILALTFLLILFTIGFRSFFSADDKITPFVYLFIISLVISTVLAENPIVSIKFSIKWIALLMAYFVIYRGISYLPRQNTIMSLLTLSACVSTLIGLFFFLIGEKALEAFFNSSAAVLFIDPDTIHFGEINWFRGGGTGGTFFNRNWYAAFIGFVLPYNLAKTLIVKKERWFWLFSSILLGIGLLVSLSRGGWIGLIGFLILLFFMIKENSKRIIFYVFIGLLILFIMVAIFTPGLWSNILERSANILVVDYKINRIAIWSTSLNMFMNNPLTGVGIANNSIGSAHSIFLQILVELGLVGTTVFLMLLLNVFFELFSKITKINSIESYVLGLGLIGAWLWLCLQGMLSTTLFNDKLFISFAIILGLTAHFVDRKTENQISD